MSGQTERRKTKVWIEGMNFPHNMPDEPLGDGIRMPAQYTAKFDNPDWPLVSIDIAVSGQRLQIDRVEFTRREGGPPVGAAKLRSIPLNTLMEFTIHLAGLRAERTESGWKLTPLGPQDESVYWEAIRQTRRRGPQPNPRTREKDAKRALQLFDEAKKKNIKPAIGHVEKTLLVSRPAAYRLVKEGREADGGNGVQRTTKGRKA